MTKSILAIFMALVSYFAQAQLKGSGEILTKNYDFTNFNQLKLEDLDGEIIVQIGTTYQVTLSISENLFDRLELEQKTNAKELKICFKNNANNKKYIEDSNLKIVITMPNLIKVEHNSNSNLKINAINESELQVINLDNGTTELNGVVQKLVVKNSGNGNVKAKNLLVDTANVSSSGNGNVYLNVTNLISATAKGNCSVFNFGTAQFDSNSFSSGNARLINN